MNFSDFRLEKTGDGLLPAIIQDARTLKVLMLGYMNEEAYEKSVREKRVTFYSRGRKRLWTKGEESGNYLDIVDIYPDCDSDTILIKAIPAGPTCHRGTTSCFDTPEEEGFIRRLEEVIKDRHSKMPEGSYTTKLFIKGVKAIAKKFGEESVEALIEACSGNRERFIYESSDVIYHLLVLMEEMGVTLRDVEKELTTRHK